MDKKVQGVCLQPCSRKSIAHFSSRKIMLSSTSSSFIFSYKTALAQTNFHRIVLQDSSCNVDVCGIYSRNYTEMT